jgi:hypothetical protein
MCRLLLFVGFMTRIAIHDSPYALLDPFQYSNHNGVNPALLGLSAGVAAQAPSKDLSFGKRGSGLQVQASSRDPLVGDSGRE